MKIGYFLSSEELGPHEPVRQGAQLQCMSEAALRVLRRHAQPRSREPMISRKGIRAQARRTRSIMSASMRDQLTGGT